MRPKGQSPAPHTDRKKKQWQSEEKGFLGRRNQTGKQGHSKANTVIEKCNQMVSSQGHFSQQNTEHMKDC